MSRIIDNIRESIAEAVSGGGPFGHTGTLSIFAPGNGVEAGDVDAAFDAFDVETLRGITRLRLRNVRAFPGCIIRLTNLEELRFFSTPADAGQRNSEPPPRITVPSWVGGLRGLKELSLSGPIRELPASLRKLTKLESLDLSYTEIKKLPRALAKLTALQTLDLSGCPLTKLPSSMGKLTNLRELEISGTGIEFLPQSITKCRQLAIKKNGPLWLVQRLKRIVRFLSPRFQFVPRFQLRLYSYMFKKLDAMQRVVNPCGWRLLPNGGYACVRNSYHCCGHSERCDYLGDKGCATESLSCKLWLCQNALLGIESVINDKSHALRRPMKKYLRTRVFFENLCHAFNIPLKGRASKFDTFDMRGDEKLNIYIDRWYDNILLRYWGNFISVEEAAKERRRVYGANGKLIIQNG